MEEHVSISKVKISVKISKINLNLIKQICEDKNIKSSMYNNFIVVRSSNNFTFVIFKQKVFKNCDNGIIRQHVNITVNSVKKIDESIDFLKSKLNCIVNSEYKIDNITATASLYKKINPKKFLEVTSHISEKIKFNPELFPSIFISHKNRKILLFRSGKLNILGGKSVEEVHISYLWISKLCADI